MKNIIIYSSLFFLLSCTPNQKKETTETQGQKTTIVDSKLKLSDTLIINKDLSISYLKIGSLNYSEFSEKDGAKFTKSKHGGLSCGESAPLWDSTISLKNDTIGIKLEFSTTWVENLEEKKEEVLSQITLNKTKAKFYNGITIGKSDFTKTKVKFGEPEQESLNFLRYKFEKINVSLIYNELGILDYVQMNAIN
ncbi:hypothetical protein [Cellulophaga algicola]|nr:hypothetical protein [Cellulophaga algicola]